MPSPLAHGAIALALWPVIRRHRHTDSAVHHLIVAGMLGIGLLGPDVDLLVSRLVTGDAFTLHGGELHSLAAGAVFGAVFAAVCARLLSIGVIGAWLLGACAWWSHVLLDTCTTGRGVLIFWPVSHERWSLPVSLFFGVRHSEPWAWQLHLLTIASELPFIALMWMLGLWISGRVLKEQPLIEIETSRMTSR